MLFLNTASSLRFPGSQTSALTTSSASICLRIELKNYDVDYMEGLVGVAVTRRFESVSEPYLDSQTGSSFTTL